MVAAWAGPVNVVFSEPAIPALLQAELFLPDISREDFLTGSC